MNPTTVTSGLCQLSVLVLIDTEAALAANTLSGNIYLIDNNQWNGSTGEGTEKLVTSITGTQIINWGCAGIDFSAASPVIADIKGEAVEKQIMVPGQYRSPTGGYWSATVDSNQEGQYAYTLKITLIDQENMPAVLTTRRRFWNVPDNLNKDGQEYTLTIPGEGKKIKLPVFEFTSYINVKRGFSNI